MSALFWITYHNQSNLSRKEKSYSVHPLLQVLSKATVLMDIYIFTCQCENVISHIQCIYFIIPAEQ